MVGCSGQIWWENKKQVSRWWPHFPVRAGFCYRFLSSRRKHPLGMGRESDCTISTVCLAEGPPPLCFAKGCSLWLSLVLSSLFCSCTTLTCNSLPF